MNVFVDGGGWTGMDCCLCVVLENRDPIIQILEEEKTNNEMEFRALIKALEICPRNSHIFSDSKIVVGHLIWGWESNAIHLKPLINKARQLLRGKQCSINWVPRDKNLAGLILENRQDKIKNYKNATVNIKMKIGRKKVYVK